MSFKTALDFFFSNDLYPFSGAALCIRKLGFLTGELRPYLKFPV